jgi:ADP-ribose pyrophosphatase YjhB (NUDIX family)
MGINNRVRAILVDPKDRLVLIKRVKAGLEPYWVAPGGGLSETDASLEACLHREIREELGGEIQILKLLVVRTFQVDEDRLVRQHYFLCRLLNYDIKTRSGPEFDDPANGEYIVEFFPLDPAVLRKLNIKSDDFKAFLISHAHELFDLPAVRPD